MGRTERTAARARWGLLLLAGFLGACANVGYMPSEGPGVLLPAKPGTKQIVDGMEVWTRGGPDRPSWVLGTVVETRGKGPIGGGGTLRGLVKQAKKRHADAVVLLQKQSQWVGDALEEFVLPDWEVNREALLIRYRQPKKAARDRSRGKAARYNHPSSARRTRLITMAPQTAEPKLGTMKPETSFPVQ